MPIISVHWKIDEFFYIFPVNMNNLKKKKSINNELSLSMQKTILICWFHYFVAYLYLHGKKFTSTAKKKSRNISQFYVKHSKITKNARKTQLNIVNNSRLHAIMNAVMQLMTQIIQLICLKMEMKLELKIEIKNQHQAIKCSSLKCVTHKWNHSVTQRKIVLNFYFHFTLKSRVFASGVYTKPEKYGP